MRACFFDIESIFSSDAKVWIVDKKNPKIPIMRIPQSDFSLIKSGLYRSQGNSVFFGETAYWLPDELMSTLKVRCKKMKADVSKVSFSMREYMDREVIETLNFEVNKDLLSGLKNSQDHIYVICSKNAKSNYDKIISKIEGILEELGVSVKKYYFISETFYDSDQDDIARNKVRLLLQHLVGLKTDGDKFTDEELQSYDEIFYYDEDGNSSWLAENCNSLLSMLVGNTEGSTKDLIKSGIKERNPSLIVRQVSPNKVNRFSDRKVTLSLHNVIRTFEAFSWKKS
jgi:hypothetical protein